MTHAAPVVCEPLFKTKPWGGRTLAELFGKRLPDADPVGESWELVSLPDAESHVARGPLAGTTLTQLIADWGADLLGDAPLVDGRFPLLIKFLDARQHLSVQVHPKPTDRPNAPPVKHEAWCVLAAEPGAELFIGLKSGVTPEDVRAAANTPAFADLLRRWPAAVGQCYYLPSGTVHALGAGIVVAEVQTPSDVTYRFYDWDRKGLDGKPRELHVPQALDNTLYDVPADQILQPTTPIAGVFGDATRVCACSRFTIDRLQVATGAKASVSAGAMRIWIVIKGAGRLRGAEGVCEFSAGDTVLIPARSEGLAAESTAELDVLEARIPT